jgi:hypothetical protein
VARVTYVAAVIGNLEHFVSEVLNLTCPREGVPAAKFRMASEPAAYRGFSLTRPPKSNGVDELTRYFNHDFVTAKKW